MTSNGVNITQRHHFCQYCLTIGNPHSARETCRNSYKSKLLKSRSNELVLRRESGFDLKNSGRSILEMSSDPIKTFAVGNVGMMIGNSSDYSHLKRPT